MDVNLLNAEVLRVAPDEVLLIKTDHPSLEDGIVEGLTEALNELGLEGRYLVILTAGSSLEMTLVAKDT